MRKRTTDQLLSNAFLLSMSIAISNASEYSLLVTETDGICLHFASRWFVAFLTVSIRLSNKSNISISARHGTQVSDALDAYNALFQARGNKLVIGENVRTFPGQVFSIIGGSDANENTTNYSSHLVVEGGAWHQVIGGGTANMGKESEGFGTNIAVRGDAQIDSVYGGGADRGNVYGSTYVLLEGNGNVGHLYGGGLINNKGIKTYGNITIDVKGGYSGIVEAGPANGTNIVNNPDEFAASTILGTATINISSSQSVGAVYGDVFRDILDKNAATRRIKGMTTLNVTASNHFADMDFFDIINIVGNDTPQSTVVYVDDVIGGGIAAGAQGITALGGYIGRLDLKNGAALFIDKNAYVNINNEPDRTISTANGSGDAAWLDHAFSGETSEERRELSTLMIDGDCITPSGSYRFDTEEGPAGLRVKGEVEGYSTLVCSGTRPDGTAYTPVYSTGDTYYYYVVADSSDTGGKAFKEPDGADYVVCYRYLSDGRIGWYLRERPTITVTNRFVRVGTGANPILNEEGKVTGSESTTEHYMILHVDMKGFAYEWSPNSDKNRVEMSWSIFDGTEAPTDDTTRTGEFTLETMASITENSENFQNVTFTDGSYYDEGETENPTKRLQSFDYILDSSTAAEPGYYVLTANWHYKRSADGGATYEDVRLGQETDAARCLYDFAGNYTDDDEVLFAADKDHGDDGYTDSVMTTYVYKDETPPKGADNALLRIYLPYGVSAAGFTAEKVAAGSGESKAFEFLEEHTGSIVRNSDVAANYTTEDETIYNHQFGVTMQHESSSEHDLDNAVNFNLSLSGIEKFYCWVYSHEKLGYEDITKWSADGLRLHMTLNGLTRDGAAVGAADDNPSTYSNGELRIQTKLATASDMVKFTVAKQITDITDPDTTAEFDFTMSYKLSDGNTKTENFALSHGKQQTFLVPAGTKVTVVESRHDGYYVRIKNSDSDEFEYSDTVTVTVTKTDSDADGVTVIFYNSPGTELPKTGGSAAAMYALGGLLTALAVCRYAHRKRRERRGEA